MTCLQILTFRKPGLIPSKNHFKSIFQDKVKQYSSTDSYYTTSTNIFRPCTMLRVTAALRHPWLSDSCKKSKKWSRNEYKPMFQMQNSGYLGYLDYKNLASKNTNLVFQPKYRSKKERSICFPCTMFLSACCIYPVIMDCPFKLHGRTGEVIEIFMVFPRSWVSWT